MPIPPPQQNVEIVMDDQYLNFINENSINNNITKDSFVKAKLCLNGALLPEERVEEVEVSVVAGQDTKIHALLLHITCDNDRIENSITKVCYQILLSYIKGI